MRRYDSWMGIDLDIGWPRVGYGHGFGVWGWE